MFLEAVELLIEEDTRAVQYCSAPLCSVGGAGCTVLFCTVLYCIPLQCRRCWLPSAPLFARRSGNSGYCSFKSGLGCGGRLSPRAAAVLALIITLLLSVLARY